MVFHKEAADTGLPSTRAAVREISSKCLCFCAKNAHRIVGKVSIVGIVGKYNERHTGETHCLERKATRTSVREYRLKGKAPVRVACRVIRFVRMLRRLCESA